MVHSLFANVAAITTYSEYATVAIVSQPIRQLIIYMVEYWYIYAGRKSEGIYSHKRTGLYGYALNFALCIFNKWTVVAASVRLRSWKGNNQLTGWS